MLKERMACVYEFICHFLESHNFAPSIREIAAGCYISTSYVIRCLDMLEAQGRLTRDPRVARSIRLTQPEQEE